MPLLKVETTKISGLKLIVPVVFEDYRGSYTETYDSNNWAEVTNNTVFIADGVSVSRKNVMRGIHGDYENIKLVTAMYGTYYAVIVDNRPDSPTYKQWESFILSGTNKHQLYIPAGCGNSVLALDEHNVYHYKQSAHYVPGKQFTLMWDDPQLKIKWPVKDMIISERDQNGEYLR